MREHNHNMISIDGDRLKAELEKKGLTGSEVGLQLGYSKGYISVCIGNEKISKVATIAIENMFGIPIERYQKVEVTNAASSVSDDELKKILECLENLNKKYDVVLEKLQKIQGKLLDKGVTKDGLKDINYPVNTPITIGSR